MTTLEVANKLCELVKAGKSLDAVDTFYADNIVSIEAVSMPGSKQQTDGKVAVRAKNVWWYENHETHSMSVLGPWPHGDRFIVYYKIDVTPKAGPMAGKRFTMEETGLYTVKDGKVVKEEFFYSMGG